MAPFLRSPLYARHSLISLVNVTSRIGFGARFNGGNTGPSAILGSNHFLGVTTHYDAKSNVRRNYKSGGRRFGVTPSFSLHRTPPGNGCSPTPVAILPGQNSTYTPVRKIETTSLTTVTF
jgi:hypothetical protein